MVQYLLLKSDGDSNDPDLGLTSDSTSDGGVLGGDTYTAAHITNVTTASGVFDKQDAGNSSSSSTPIATKVITTGTDQLGVLNTSAQAGGFTELFTHADQPANLDTSSVVNALTESFDTVQRTALGDALSGVTGDTTVATTNTSQSLANAIAEPLVAAEQASLTVQDGDGFADAFVDALRASGSGLPTAAVGDAAVTSLGQTEVAVGTPQFDDAVVELFVFVSPETTTATPTTGAPNTTTDAVALTENAVMMPITPTMDIVVSVGTTDIGLESAFADSLAASVGAETFIKVSKERANATPQSADLDTDALPDAVAAVADMVGQTGSPTTQSTAEALIVAAALQSFGTSSTSSDVVGSVGNFDPTEIDGDAFASAVPDAAVRNAVASELDASADSSATSEALAESAQTLTEQGLADTQTEAAALVSQVAAQRQRSSVAASAYTKGDTESFDTVERTGLPTTESLSELARQVFDVEEVDAVVDTSALLSGEVSTAGVQEFAGSATTLATVEALVEEAGLSPLEAFTYITFLSFSGKNRISLESGQNIDLRNKRNRVEVLN